LEGVIDGIRLLEKTNYGEPAFIGKRVAVLGAGFTAMDCCRTAIRFGAEKVYVMYRRSKEEAGSDEYEVDEAMYENVEFQYLVTQTAISSNDGVHVSGMSFIRNKLGDPDASGRRRSVGAAHRVRKDDWQRAGSSRARRRTTRPVSSSSNSSASPIRGSKIHSRPASSRVRIPSASAWIWWSTARRSTCPDTPTF